MGREGYIVGILVLLVLVLLDARYVGMVWLQSGKMHFLLVLYQGPLLVLWSALSCGVWDGVLGARVRAMKRINNLDSVLHY